MAWQLNKSKWPTINGVINWIFSLAPAFMPGILWNILFQGVLTPGRIPADDQQTSRPEDSDPESISRLVAKTSCQSLKDLTELFSYTLYIYCQTPCTALDEEGCLPEDLEVHAEPLKPNNALLSPVRPRREIR